MARTDHQGGGRANESAAAVLTLELTDVTPEALAKVNSEYASIPGWLKKVKFRRRLIGGVDEHDVWKKIGELNDRYTRALVAERARYDALLATAGVPPDTGPEAPGRGGDST